MPGKPPVKYLSNTQMGQSLSFEMYTSLQPIGRLNII